MSRDNFIKLSNQGKKYGFDDGIDLEKYGAKHINKPPSMQQYSEHEDYYTNNPQHYIINGVIDLNKDDWDYHLSIVCPYESGNKIRIIVTKKIMLRYGVPEDICPDQDDVLEIENSTINWSTFRRGFKLSNEYIERICN